LFSVLQELSGDSGGGDNALPAPKKTQFDVHARKGSFLDQSSFGGYALLNFGRNKAAEIESFLYRNPQPRSTCFPYISKDDKAIAVIAAFQNHTDFSETQLLKYSRIADTTENREFLKSLVVDGK
jgi:hypothetical protein